MRPGRPAARLPAIRSVTMSAAALSAALWGVAPGPAGAQDIMSSCAPEIGRFCADVSKGRGRILACLISRDGQLSAACSADVMATAQRGSSNPLVPSGVRTMVNSGGGGSVPAACGDDVGRLCNGIGPDAGKVLACLYARSNRVSSGCNSAVRSELR